MTEYLRRSRCPTSEHWRGLSVAGGTFRAPHVSKPQLLIGEQPVILQWRGTQSEWAAR